MSLILEVDIVLKYTIERLIYGLVTLFLIVMITFFLLTLLPGSPFNDQKLDKEQIAMLNEKYGLDKPIAERFVKYLVGVVHLDFGKSFKYDNQEVMKDLILPRLPRTIRIGVVALLIGVGTGLILGSISALTRGSFIDNFIIFLIVLGTSIPGFVFAMFLQYKFAVQLGWLPVLYEDGNFASYWLPGVSLAISVGASITRFTRTELVEVLNSDYILLARAKGLTGTQVVARHAIRNAMIPLITVIGPMVISVMTGGVVMETIFGVPGIGQLVVKAISENDYFIIMADSTVMAFLYIVVIIIIDLTYGIIDPRIRLAGGK